MRCLYLAAVAVLLVACSDRAPLEPIADSPADAAFNFMNNPDVGNLKVYRFQDDMRVCWTDPANGLRACHSNFPYADPDCGIQSDEAPLGFQTVTIDADNIRTITNATGDVFIFVRDTNAPGVCFDNALVAEGWGTLRYNDNDSWGTGMNNANHWGYTAHGALHTSSGDRTQYSGEAQYRWNGRQFFRALSEKVDVH
jgi:hypothetical protein